jgi:hypothetical protein
MLQNSDYMGLCWRQSCPCLENLRQLNAQLVGSESFRYSPVQTLPDSFMRSSHEMRAFRDDVMTKRFTVGTFRAEVMIPVVSFTAGWIMSRSYYRTEEQC